uniref:C-type lectin domain-containing protein n=1 Tax=Panagrellus redivivus TaxID=6233 RepID=A0A7E5A0F7_PANRE
MMRLFFIFLSALSTITTLCDGKVIHDQVNTGDAATVCGSGWYYSQEFDSCYIFLTIHQTFEDAKNYCWNSDSELVSIYSELEYYIVSAFMEQQDNVYPYWIGLQTYIYSPPFRWLDHTNANYTHFINGSAPSNTDRNACFAWYKMPANDGWHISNCSNLQPFICKRHLRVDTITRVNGTTGTLSSPNYPAPYYADSVALYYIDVPEGYVIELSFGFIAIDSTSRITVFENNASVATITSEQNSVTSKTNHLKVEFDSSKEGNSRYIGWSAKYNAIVPVTREGSFNSPNYPSHYDGNENITKRVQVPDDFNIIFTIWDFSSEVNADYLDIYEGNNLHLRLTGTPAVPLTYFMPNTQATLIWHSSPSTYDRGFNLTWAADPIWV